MAVVWLGAAVLLLRCAHIDAQTCDDYQCSAFGPPCPDSSVDGFATRCASGCASPSEICGGGALGGMVYFSSGGAMTWNRREIYNGQSIECCDGSFGCSPVGNGECWS